MIKLAVYSRKLAKGLRYFYKFDLKGRMVKSPAKYPKAGDAKQAEAEHRQRLEEEILKPKAEATLKEVMESRLDLLETQKSREYYKQNQRCYQKFLAFTGKEILAAEVTRKMVQDYLIREAKSYRERNCTNSLVNQQLRLLKALFSHALLFDIEKNPCSRIELFSMDKKLKRIPSCKEIHLVMDECNDRQMMLLEFLMETGARINEALKARGKDLANGFIVLYTRKSRNSDLVPRKVPLRPDFFQGLTFKPEERIFPDWGESVDFRPHFLGRVIMKLKQEPWGFHHLRHWYASKLIMERTPLTIVQQRLGHTSVTTTALYLQALQIEYNY